MIDLGGGKTATGNEAIAQLAQTPGHKAAIAGGLAHFAGLPRIDIEGDRAVVTSYLQILTPHPTAEPVEVPNHGTSKASAFTAWCKSVGVNPDARRVEDQTPHVATIGWFGARARNFAASFGFLQMKG